MTRRRKIQFIQLFYILIAWEIAAFVIQCYDYFLLHSVHVPSGKLEVLGMEYSFWRNVAYNALGVIIAAGVSGYLFVFYLNVKFRNKPYGYTILLTCIVFIVFMYFTVALTSLGWIPSQSGIHFGEPGFWDAFRIYMTDTFHLKQTLAYSLVTAATQFVLLMNVKFGYGVLWDLIRGKYHLPKEETRIFMFADLDDSTTIAEKLGNERFHELLQDFFSDLTDPIIDNRGDIIQYIGDEIVIAWKYESGIRNNQCIDCFFDMKKQIENNSQHYLDKFGLVPGFKAGIHFGKVTAGEVGIVKRDITFSGDVLNTTARIESKCKEFNVDLIASDELLSQLSYSDRFVSKNLGEIKLKGKEKEVGLSALLARV